MRCVVYENLENEIDELKIYTRCGKLHPNVEQSPKGKEDSYRIKDLKVDGLNAALREMQEE